MLCHHRTCFVLTHTDLVKQLEEDLKYVTAKNTCREEKNLSGIFNGEVKKKKPEKCFNLLLFLSELLRLCTLPSGLLMASTLQQLERYAIH